MLQAFLPPPAGPAGGGELLDGEISQHSYAAEVIRAGAGRVRIKLAVGNGCESGVARHLERALGVASSGTREGFGLGADDIFDLEPRSPDFALEFGFREIGEIRVGPLMAADLKPLRVEIVHLAGAEVTRRAQES